MLRALVMLVVAGALGCSSSGGSSDGGADGAIADGSATADRSVPGDAAACTPPCGPGQACVGGACIEDCRVPLARPCDTGLVCSDMSGRCVVPGEDCTPLGEFVRCGTAEFPPTCGPGTVCDVAVCTAAAGCERVACDVAGVCRGVGCATAGSGSVSGISLDPLADVPRGAPDAVVARGRVEGEALCSLTVTLELRIETSLFVSAYNDAAVWEVDLRTGARTSWAAGITGVNGLATDPTGALYVLQGCTVGRISEAVRTFTPIATLLAGSCSRLAVGPDGALYVSTRLEAWRVDPFTGASSAHGAIPDGIAAWGSTFLTGLGFLADGSLVLGEHWRDLRRIPPGGGPAEPWAQAPALALTSADNPWNEGMGLGPDDLLYVGVFPTNPTAGFVYRVEADGSTTVLVDLAAMQTSVPTTTYSGIHGVAFGLDGSMYFTNQNTRGATFEPLGQLLVRRTDGSIALLVEGFNFDWPRGYDGDLVVGTESLATVTVPVLTDGSFEATFDAPDIDGAFEVRASATDPSTGRVYGARSAARTR